MTPALLAPAALALAALALGPLLVHLSRRRPQRDIPYGAMLLLRRLMEQRRRRRRVSDPLLLALRVAAVLAAVAAVSRPELRWAGEPPPGAQVGPVVVLLDDSLSMDQAMEGGTAFAVARAEAAAWVRALPEGTRVGAVAFGAGARRVVPEMTEDRGAVAAAIETWARGHGGTDLAAGLREARRLLDGQGGRVRVWTDEAGPGAVPAAREELSLMAAQRVALEPRVVRPARPANLSIVDAVVGDGVEGGTVRVRVANHGDAAVEAPIHVTLPDGVRITAFADVPPGGEAEELVTVPRVAEGGVGEVRVDDPALEADTTSAVHLPRVGASRVLVVDGDPGATPTASEVYFLERALAPWGADAGQHAGVLPDVTATAAVATLDPDVHRVVILANVSDPSPLSTRLADFVRRGGGVVLALGDNVTPDAYNGALAPLLPSPLRRVTDLAAPGQPGLTTEAPDLRHPLFRPFARGGGQGFSKVRWSRLYTLEPYEDGPERSTLLRTATGLPVLVERVVGAGRVLLWTGTLDMGWGDLPLQAVYMPLVQRMVSYLGAETQGAGERISGEVGEVLSVELPAADVDARVEGPAGPAPAQVRGGRVVFTPDLPGRWAITRADGGVIALAAVRTPPAESQVAPGPALLELAADVDPDTYLRRFEFAPWLLGLALLLGLVQALLAGRPDPRPAAEERSDAA